MEKVMQMQPMAGVPLCDFPIIEFEDVAHLVDSAEPTLCLRREQSSGQTYLFYWVDQDSSAHRWLVWPVEADRLKTYSDGHLPLLATLQEAGQVYVVDIERQASSLRTRQLTLDQLPDRYLPAETSFCSFN